MGTAKNIIDYGLNEDKAIYNLYDKISFLILTIIGGYE